MPVLGKFQIILAHQRIGIYKNMKILKFIIFIILNYLRFNEFYHFSISYFYSFNVSYLSALLI